MNNEITFQKSHNLKLVNGFCDMPKRGSITINLAFLAYEEKKQKKIKTLEAQRDN